MLLFGECMEYYIGLAAEIVSCPIPVCDTNNLAWPLKRTITRTITHLNDHHHMSFRWIADWLDTLPFDITFAGKEVISVAPHSQYLKLR